MVSVLALSAVYGGFESRSGQAKTIKLVFDAYLLSTQHYGEKAKTSLLGIRIRCPSGTTCLSTDCCFSELAILKNPTMRVGLIQSGPHNHFIVLAMI